MFKRITLGLMALLALCTLSTLPAEATYTVDPLRVEMVVSEKGTAATSLRVQNTGNETIRLRAYVQSWSLDENGGLKVTEEAQPNAVTDWIKFNPREFEIPGGGSQIVRMAISTPPGTEMGEYRGMLFFEDLKTNTQRLKENTDGYGASVEIKQRLGIAIYAYKGSPLADPQLAAFQCEVKDGRLNGVVQIANTGTRHARITGTLLLQQQTPAGTYKPFREVHLNDLREIIVLPGSTRTVDQILIDSGEFASIPPGNFKADLKLSWKGAKGNNTSSSVQFAVPGGTGSATSSSESSPTE